MTPIKVLGISGSLRKGSYNTAALEAAQGLTPNGMVLEIYGPLNLPMYSEEGARNGFPKDVAQFRARVATADAILFACPEYNYAVPAVLKNALEWASRPPDPPFTAKACALFGATTSPLGTMRAQTNLRQVCVSLNLHPINVPQVDIAAAQQKFNAEGKLNDAASLDALRTLLGALYDMARRLHRDE